MAFPFGTHFLLCFLWFSGVNQLVHPSTDAGSGLDPVDYPGDEEQQAEESRRGLLLPLTEEYYRSRPLSGALPPMHLDPIQDEPYILRRQYRLEDFLWTGSGDGPHPSEVDGGLAWEDNGGGGITPHFGGGASSFDSQKNWIRVTKTMTLYRTVLTTIYPVEMTPTVISGHHGQPTPTPSVSMEEPQPTPVLPHGGVVSGGDLISASPSSDLQSSFPELDVNLDPTPAFSPTAPPEPTASPPMPSSPSPTPMSPSKDNFSEGSLPVPPASTDPVFWIRTIIKANNSAYRDTPLIFQQTMQKSLAQVYASAFKRHLLATLGLLPAPPPSNPNSKNRRKRSGGGTRRRSKRWSYHGGDGRGDSDNLDENKDEDNHGGDDDEEDDHLHQWLYVAQSSMSPQQLKHLATAAMNVTVAIINVTEEAPPKVDLRYVVMAEGSPVPAFSAVKELELVSKREMEEMLGYEIINKKAEALVAGPPEQMTRNEQYVATSPWLIVAVTTICLLVILLALIGFMVWKWKHNRLGDAVAARGGGGRRQVVSSAGPPARPQSGIGDDDDEHDEGGDDEEGVINPAFLGTPKHTGRGETLDPSPKSSPSAAQSLLSARARARTAGKRLSEVIAATTRLPSSRSTSTSKSKSKSKTNVIGGDEVEVIDDEDDSRRGDKKKRGDQQQQQLRWNSPSSSEDMRVHKKVTMKPSLTSSEGSADWKELLGEPKPKMPPRKRSPVRGAKSGGGGGGASGQKSSMSGSASKEMLRRRRKKSKVAEEANLRTDFEGEEEDDDDEEEDEDEREGASRHPPPKQQQPWTKGITDAISLGNLDIFQDSAIAQTPSEYARRLVPWKRPGSAVGAQPSTSSGGASSTQPYFLPSSHLDPTSGVGGRRGTPSSQTRIQTIDEIPSFDQLDRELSERSESPPPPPTSSPPVDTKEQGVQTPTRISKTASHKQRAGAKPRKNWRGSPGGGESSVISTESEEIVEVHHVGGGLPEDQNPLGRMRKRFHQFLDDAFNVMVSGGRQGDDDNPVGGGGDRGDDPLSTTAGPSGGRTGASRRGGGGGRAAETQSAKVSISHEVVETETEWRPWTSHVIREETLQKLKRGRPKSAAVPAAQVIGPPKPAWTASSERRTHSAKGGGSGQQGGSSAGGSRLGSAVDIQSGGRSSASLGGGGGGILMRRSKPPRNFEEEMEEDDDTYDKTSTRDDPPPITQPNKPTILSSSADPPSTSTSLSAHHSQSVILSPAFIFPQYPAYPDIRVSMGGSAGGPVSSTSTSTAGSSSLSQSQAPPIPPPPTLPPNDPAVPLIQAIKNEMKRFEKEPPPNVGGGGGATSTSKK